MPHLLLGLGVLCPMFDLLSCILAERMTYGDAAWEDGRSPQGSIT